MNIPIPAIGKVSRFHDFVRLRFRFQRCIAKLRTRKSLFRRRLFVLLELRAAAAAAAPNVCVISSRSWDPFRIITNVYCVAKGEIVGSSSLSLFLAPHDFTYVGEGDMLSIFAP